MKMSGPSLDTRDTPFNFNGRKICPGDDLGDFGNGTLNNAYARIGQAASKAKVGFVVVQRGDSFFVSPLRTVSDALLQILGAFERSDFEKGGAIYELFAGDFGFGSSERKFNSVANAIGPEPGVPPSTVVPRNSHVPPPTDPPQTNDPNLEALALACWSDPRAGCDDLKMVAETRGSEEMARYGRTCGGRIPDPGPNPPLTFDEIFG